MTSVKILRDSARGCCPQVVVF